MQCCFKSGGNNYYKYLVVLSVYGCAGHILTSIVTRWAQLLSMQESERASEWDEDTVLSIGCGFHVLHSLSDFSISSVCVLTCKHPQWYKFVVHFGERAFSLKAVVCYENRRWWQRQYGVHPDKSHVCVCQSLTLTLSKASKKLSPHESNWIRDTALITSSLSDCHFAWIQRMMRTSSDLFSFPGGVCVCTNRH